MKFYQLYSHLNTHTHTEPGREVLFLTPSAHVFTFSLFGFIQGNCSRAVAGRQEIVQEDVFLNVQLNASQQPALVLNLMLDCLWYTERGWIQFTTIRYGCRSSVASRDRRKACRNDCKESGICVALRVWHSTDHVKVKSDCFWSRLPLHPSGASSKKRHDCGDQDYINRITRITLSLDVLSPQST